MAAYTKTVRTRTLVVQKFQPDMDYILGELSLTSVSSFPLNFARWPGGAIYISDGLNPIHKWDGAKATFIEVGIETPSGTPAFSTSGSGTIDGDYVAYVRFLDADGLPGPLSAASATVTATDDATVSYTSIPVPTTSRVVSKQILRSTAGQATMFFVDVDTEDLAGTTFSSTNTDSDLDDEDFIITVDSEGNVLLNSWDAPRSDKPCLAPHRQRMFAAGETIYKVGHVEVTFGSTTVTGRGTAWLSTFADRVFRPVGSNTVYTIASCDEANQTLTLDDPYREATDLFTLYQIEPEVGQRNKLYYSSSTFPDLWPDTNDYPIAESGDIITALVPTDSFLYVMFRRESFRFMFTQDPGLDGEVSSFAHRGCVSQRTWCKLGEAIYVLDHLGIWRLDGGAGVEIAQAIRDMWSMQIPSDFKVHWGSSEYFHAASDHENQVVRFFVTLGGPGLPRHAICYSALLNQWWIEQYPYPISSSLSWPRPDDHDRVVLGSAAMKLMEMNGTLDGVNAEGMVSRARVSAATPLSVTAPTLVLPTSGVVGHPVAIVEGKGKGQYRLASTYTASTGKIVIDQPWQIEPDTTSVLQIGGVLWKYRTGWYEQIGKDAPVTVTWTTLIKGQDPKEWKPLDSHQKMGLKIYVDHEATPIAAETTFPISDEKYPVQWTEAEDEGMVNLVHPLGRAQIMASQIRMVPENAAPFQSVEIGGFSGATHLVVHTIQVGAVEP